MGGVGKAGSVGGLRPRRARIAKRQRAIETRPQHVCPEGDADLAHEQMAEPSLRQADLQSQGRERHGLVKSTVDFSERAPQPNVEIWLRDFVTGEVPKSLPSDRREVVIRRVVKVRVLERGAEMLGLGTIEGDNPSWRPVNAYDDGRKVYIEFSPGIAQGEMPPLFVIGQDGKPELVNYRVYRNVLIADCLFAAAELRLGADKQQKVRIVRNDGRRP